MSPRLQTIVAEVSVHWPHTQDDGRPQPHDTVSQRLAEIVEANRQRGYRLSSWRFSQAVPTPGHMVETIIAVFESTYLPTESQ